MTASHSLLPETMRVEADHAKLMRRLDDLHRQYDLEDRQALAAFEDRLKAIDAQFDKERADIAAQLDLSLRETIEKVLRQKRDLEVEMLQRTHHEQVNARRKRYDEQKKTYEREIYPLITALMRTRSGLAADHLPQPPTARLPEKARDDSQSPVRSGQTSAREGAAAPPAPTEVPPQPQKVAPPPPTQDPMDTAGQPPPSRDESGDVAGRSPPSFGVHVQNNAPLGPPRRLRAAEQDSEDLASFVPCPATPSGGTEAAPGNQQHLPESAGPVGRPGELSALAEPRLAEFEPAHKRKANGGSNHELSMSPEKRIKRTKLDRSEDDDSAAADQPSPEQKPPDRTVSFEDVYGEPGEPPQYRHIIVEYPSSTGNFYILRCDEHGVHFGEHPLRGAAKHLASAQHGYMSKAHATAIETLGHRVLGCTRELADKNNRDVLKAFRDGAYKVFNANNLSQARRAQLGYPPLDPQGTQKAAMQRKPTFGITNPTACRFYVGAGAEMKCPVLILPWGDTSPAGIHGTLAETGLFHEVTNDAKQLRVPKLPKCYVYHQVGGRVVGISGWASGYEAGGQLERKREFPVLCAENADYRFWTVGWVKAAHLSPLDFDDASSRSIPFYNEARDYFVHRILGRRVAIPDRSREAGRNPADGDVEMKDAGAMRNDGHDSDQDTASKAMTESDNGDGRADQDSRRTSVSDRDQLTGESNFREGGAAVKSTPVAMTDLISPTTHARVIAAQALNLQAPTGNAFKPINAAGSRSGTNTPRAPSESVEPPSRAGSVPGTWDGHRRVFKIHARSRSEHPTNQGHATPPIALPGGSADGALTQDGPATQPGYPQRKPSPASLQNILQEFPSSNLPPSRLDSQFPKPAGTRRPLPSAPMRTVSHSRPLLPAIGTERPETPRETRAGSAPAQPPRQRDPWDNATRRAGSAATAPGPSRDATPQPAAPESGQKREQPLHIQLPPLPTPFTPNPQFSTTPLATPGPSAGNTRANSPIPVQPNADTPTPSTAKPETPIPTPALSQPSAFLPTMDVFDLSGFIEGSKELFRSSVPGHYLRLIDDHQTGVLTTPSDSPVAVRIDPKKIKTVERMSSQGGTVGIVKILYHASEVEGMQGAEGQQRTHTLVLETARSTANGAQNGVVHARRFCRRLKKWNQEMDCLEPVPTSLDSKVHWQFGSQTPSSESKETVGPGSGANLGVSGVESRSLTSTAYVSV